MVRFGTVSFRAALRIIRGIGFVVWLDLMLFIIFSIIVVCFYQQGVYSRSIKCSVYQRNVNFVGVVFKRA